MSNTTGGEHTQTQALPLEGAGGGKVKVASPEKLLNGFVRLVAVIERLGNALGTLAFTWATVILLGGYPTVLRSKDDFPFATIIVFLEALRMFSRGNRKDYDLFFSTRGAFTLLGLNGMLTAIVYFSIVLLIHEEIVKIAVLIAIGLLMLSPRVLKLLSNSLHHGISLWSPLLAILLVAPCIPQPVESDDDRGTINYTNSPTRWILYAILLLISLLTTISRLRFPCIVKLVDSFVSRKLLVRRQFILNLCMFASIGMLVFSLHELTNLLVLIGFQVLVALLLVSLGNFQIPAAVLRVVLASIRLHSQCYIKVLDDVCKHNNIDENLNASMNIFYGIVLGQGILYIIACLLEVFSSIPRRRLIRRAGFRGQLGVEYVNRYYAYALEKCMEGAMLAPKRISLVTFAMDSIDSDSSKNRLYGVQVLHSLLNNEQLRTRTISKLTTSTKTVATLFSMLAWTSHGDAETRLFAAKVAAELPGSLRIVHIPTVMQLVASLLDTDHHHQQKTRQHFLLIDIQDAQEQCSTIQQGEHNSSVLHYWKRMAIYCFIPADEPSTMDQQSSYLHTCWKRMTKFWSIPEEEPPSDQDCLPMQGLLILERLANFDAGNCMEISKATGLITKMIDFTSYRNHLTGINNEAQQIILIGLSLRVLRRLASTKGKSVEPEYVFIRELTTMIRDDNDKYTAASLLGNMIIACPCEHARKKLSKSDLNDLCDTLPKVLEGVMNAEGAELEVLIGLSSQICKAIPEDFAGKRDDGQIKERFVERLVAVLNANMRPSAHCPGIRRVIVEHAIHLMKCNSRYVNDFHKCGMVEALSKVESTPSVAENYRLFLGDAGLMKHKTPLDTLVDTAKEVMM
ncbi:hypothetical protein ABZP36_010411 [Zizania latifolia]